MHVYAVCVTDDDVAHAPDDAQSYASNFILNCIQSTLSFTNTKRRLNTQSTRCQYAHDFNDEARRSFVFILFIVFLSSFLFTFWGDGVRSPKYIQSIKMSMCLFVCAAIEINTQTLILHKHSFDEPKKKPRLKIKNKAKRVARKVDK